MKVREFLEDYCFADNDTVFLCQLGKHDTHPCFVRDIPDKILKRPLVTVQAHFGGVEYEYNSHRFIYK